MDLGFEGGGSRVKGLRGTRWKVTCTRKALHLETTMAHWLGI